MDQLQMLLKYQTVKMKYMMFGMNPTMKHFLIKKRGKYYNSLITDDERILSILRNIYSDLKENFPNHKQKHNVSLKLWHEVNTKNIEHLLVDNKQEPWHDHEVKILTKPSTYGQIKN